MLLLTMSVMTIYNMVHTKKWQRWQSETKPPGLSLFRPGLHKASLMTVHSSNVAGGNLGDVPVRLYI